VQGKTPKAAQQLIDDARALEDAGAFAVGFACHNPVACTMSGLPASRASSPASRIRRVQSALSGDVAPARNHTLIASVRFAIRYCAPARTALSLAMCRNWRSPGTFSQ
jgi:hypothetical protein